MFILFIIYRKENADIKSIINIVVSVLGFYSFRNTKNGSPFIKALCEVFNLNSRFKDALSMMTMVNREVHSKWAIFS